MEFKHFSHVHGLTIYHMPEGSETLCSGCNLGGLTTVYMCWQCQFFIHEQCFNAKRSLPHHPSHLAHPLSFFPSPTHPSATFLCNSCHHSGTGFCYACADCNFDLHVHCAYNSLSTTSDHRYHHNHSFNHLINNYSYPPGMEFETPDYNNNHFTYPPISSDPYPPPVQTYNPSVLDTYPPVSHPYGSENNNPPIIDSYPHVRPYGSENNNPPIVDSYPPPVRSYVYENNPPVLDPYAPPPVSHPQPVRQYASENNNPHIPAGPASQIPEYYQHPNSQPNPASSSSTDQNQVLDPYAPPVTHPQPVRQYASENNNPHIPAYYQQPKPASSTDQNQVLDAYAPPPVSHPQPVRQYASENSPHIPASPASQFPASPASQIPAYYQQPKPASSSSSTDQNPVLDAYAPPPVSHPPPVLDAHPQPVRQYASENNPSIPASPASQIPANYPHPNSQPKPASSSSSSTDQNPVPDAYAPPPVSHYTSENNPSIPAIPASQIPANYPQPNSDPKPTPSTDQNQTQQQQQTQVAKHFSHQHALRQTTIHEEEGLLCSGCEQALSNQAYTCTKSKLCEFRLHKSCYDLPKEIQHKSHKPHPLSLLSTPPSKTFYIPEFTCSACLKTGNSFLYHCSDCNFNLHVNCAFLPESVKRTDHEHPLYLLHSSPYKKPSDGGDEVVFMCNVCEGGVDPKCWVYYCKDCDFGTELGCVNGEVEVEVEKGEDHQKEVEDEDEVTLAEKMIEMQSSYQRMQIQMEMSHQNALFMARIGQSFSNLAG